MTEQPDLPLACVAGAIVPPLPVPELYTDADADLCVALAEHVSHAWAWEPNPTETHPVGVLVRRWARWIEQYGLCVALERVQTDTHTRPPNHWHASHRRGRGQDPRSAGWKHTRRCARVVVDRIVRLARLRPCEHVEVLADRIEGLGRPATAAALRGQGEPDDRAARLAWVLGLRQRLGDGDPITVELLVRALGWTGLEPTLWGGAP